MLGFSSISETPISAQRVLVLMSAMADSSASSGASTTLLELLRNRDIPLDIVAEITLRNIATDTLTTIYSGTREFATLPNDSPANQPIAGTLMKALGLDRTIVNGGRFGLVTQSWGEMELLNVESDYDDYLDKFAIDGQRVVVKVAVAGSRYNAYFTLYDGTASGWQADDDLVRVSLRDNSFKLDVPAQPALYAGTGGPEGTADLKGKRKPLLYGACLNVTPVLVVASQLLYQVHGGAVKAIDAVYDRGVALTFAQDYPSSATLRGASTGAAGSGAAIEAGKYATCLAQGLFRLGGAPAGTVTADVRGDATGGVYVETTATILRRLVTSAATVLTDASLALYSFTTVDMLQPAPVGYYLDGSTDATVSDVVADLMGSVGGWGGMRRDGKYELGIFTAPSGNPTASYDLVDIEENGCRREKLPDGLSPTPYRFRVGYARNWTLQGDVSGQAGVTADRVSFLAEALGFAASSQTRANLILADHPLAQDSAPVESYFRDAVDAQAEADRLILLYGREMALYRTGLKLHPFVHEMGEVIRVTYPRYGLKNGKSLRTVSITDDTSDDRVEVVAFG